MIRRFRIGWMAAFAAGLFAAVVSTAAGPEAPGPGSPPAGGATRVPVIVELFTSEGCSSCPPADGVLTRLVTTQPVAGAQIIALGEHVDYWDRLGWRDPFSSRSLSARQSVYDEKVFHRGSVYTPQMVVDGREEFTGSDYGAAMTAVKKALGRAEARARVTVSAACAPSGASVVVSASADVSPEVKVSSGADVLVALVEDGLVTRVLHGENSGRLLSHCAVVRTLKPVGAVSVRESHWSGAATLPLSAGWNAGALKVVAFVQERLSRRILGATSMSLQNGAEGAGIGDVTVPGGRVSRPTAASGCGDRSD